MTGQARHYPAHTVRRTARQSRPKAFIHQTLSSADNPPISIFDRNFLRGSLWSA